MRSKNLIYGNYEVYHPSGKLMFYCNEKKFKWYVEVMKIAEVTEDKKAKLLFEPKGEGENSLFLNKRENICINCGATEHLTLHHIVPKMFRTHFPEEYKDHNCFDVACLCSKCHGKYEMMAAALKKELIGEAAIRKATEIGIMLSNVRVIEQHGDKIPADKVEMLKESIKAICAKYNITIEQAESYTPRDEYKSIVERIGVEELILMWKKHFTDNMPLTFMPDWWNPNLVKVLGENTNNYKK